MAYWSQRRESMPSAARRRAYAIHAYVGSNGGGKSLAMMHDTLPTLDRGLPVLSTVRILDYNAPRDCPGGDACDDPGSHEPLPGYVHQAAHPNYVPFRDYSQLLEFSHGDVLMDEVTGVASSRESQSMPVQVVNFLMQLRRREVTLRWTAPNWARADKVIREVTQAVTSCVGMMPVDSGDADRLWRDRRLFRWLTFDSFEFDEFTSHKRDESQPLLGQWFWRPGSITERSYDTFDPVLALGAATETGVCITCGGTRRRKPCSCADHVEPKKAPRVRDLGTLEAIPDLRMVE